MRMSYYDNTSEEQTIHAASIISRSVQGIFLATKVHAPRIRSPYIDRPVLTAQLESGIEGDLTLVSAGAGSGKTALLAHWLQITQTPSVWLSLEVEDNEPIRFFSYFISALQTRFPQLGSSSLALLIQSPQFISLEHVMAMLSNEIMTSDIPHFTFICDDYHLIQSDVIHSAMLFLLEHLPPQMHLVIATRVDPPFPLTRLRAHGRLTEIRAQDLRLTQIEIQNFLQTTVTSHLLDSDTLSTIEQRTEGWITGVQLAALSLRGYSDPQKFLQAFRGSHKFVLDYLSEEVLLQQSPSAQSFLLTTSILDRLTASLCNALTERSDGQEQLERLEKANLFVISLDDERQWYRYHHLFADVLRTRLEQSVPDRITALHLRASQWYEQHAFTLEAIQHAVYAHNELRLVALLEQYGYTCLFQHEIPGLVLEWISKLSLSLVQTHIHLCLLQAIAYIYTNQQEKAPEWLQRTENLVTTHLSSTQEVSLIRGRISACYALIYFSHGEIVQSAEYAQQALTLLSENEDLLRLHAMQCAIRSYRSTGDVTQETEKLAVSAVGISRASLNTTLFLMSMTNLAWIQILRGRLHQAQATYREVSIILPEQEQRQIQMGSAHYYIGMGYILYEWDELVQAKKYLLRGIKQLQTMPLKNAELTTLGHITLARLYKSQQAYSEARETVEQLNVSIQDQHFSPHLRTWISAVQAEIELSRGNLDAAQRSLEADTQLQSSKPDFLYEQAEYMKIRIYIAQARQTAREQRETSLRALLQTLDQRQYDAEKKDRHRSVLEIFILKTLILDLIGKQSETQATIEQALKLAEPEGYIRLFADEGKPMSLLLARVPGKHPHQQAYIQQLQNACQPQIVKADIAREITDSASLKQPNRSQQELIDPLSERELEVLQLLATGASNYDIAQKLVIAVSTVKRHVTNIITKLNVNNRTQAVAEARKYGLL